MFFCSVASVNAKSDTSNYTSCAEQDYKNGFCVTYGKDSNLPNYNAEAVVFMGNYIENKKEGIWKQYFPEGTLMNEIEYKNNRANGYAKFYNDKGVIIEEGTWKTRKWTGIYITRYDNGNVKYQWNYGERGLRENVQEYYHLNGQIMYRGEFNGGKETGVHQRWNEDGVLIEEIEYKDGQLIDFKAIEPPTKPKPKPKPLPTVVNDTGKIAGADTTGIMQDSPSSGKTGKFWGYYKDYDKKTGQLRRDGYFEAGIFKDGWIYKYKTVKDKFCKTKIEIGNYRTIKTMECEYGEGEKKRPGKKNK